MLIAQNGAGAPLLDNTLEATTLAIAQGVDCLELPVVLSSDGHLLVYDDLTLNGRTDVGDVFPNRNSEDGNFYINDFTLAEIRQLRLKNTFDNDPLTLTLPIPTLLEELSLIKRLEAKLNTTVGIMLEIKYPWFFRESGQDISQTVLELLDVIEYDQKETLYIQCFHPEELQRIHSTLLPERNISYPLIQMIDSNDGEETKVALGDHWKPYNYDWLFTNTGLRIVASYANVIALPLKMLSPDTVEATDIQRYLNNIHKAGLKLFVHTETGTEEVTLSSSNLQQVMEPFEEHGSIDGVYLADYFSEQENNNDKQKDSVQQEAELPPFFSNLGLTLPTENDEELPQPQEISVKDTGMN